MINKENVKETDVEEILKQNFADWDAERAARLKDLLVVKQSKAELQARNFERLEEKYGTSHPLVEQTRRKIQLERVYAAELNLEIIRAETPLPQNDGKSWLVHGYVFDKEETPVAGATVLFFDGNGKPLHRSERTKTGKNGYYVLETDNIANFPPRVRVGVSKDDLSEEDFTPKIGATDYAEIFASGKGEPPSPGEEPSPPVTSDSDWTVTGKIVDANGRGIKNLTVYVYDEDLKKDDYLGTSKTDENGAYTVSFNKAEFKDFIEKYPELYLVIKNEKGEELYNGKNEGRAKKRYIELLDVQIDKS